MRRKSLDKLSLKFILLSNKNSIRRNSKMPATTKAAPKVKDLTEPVKEFSGTVKENYLNGIDITFSLWEQNINAINSQVDQIISLEEEFVSNVNEFYKDFPKDLPFVNGKAAKVTDQFDKYLAYRKEQAQAAKSVGEKFTKEARTNAEANVEKVF
jgi:hypothetical protein